MLLHGQMRPREKQEAMAAFAAGGADVLVATTVIEVGIDVPNATVMLVEDAERYGISQLHQLRGRIGRGAHASVCLLFGPKESRRLRALAEHRDGFDLAEIDLELRGEGEMLGVRQSGLQAFRFARLPEDVDAAERAPAATRATSWPPTRRCAARARPARGRAPARVRRRGPGAHPGMKANILTVALDDPLDEAGFRHDATALGARLGAHRSAPASTRPCRASRSGPTTTTTGSRSGSTSSRAPRCSASRRASARSRRATSCASRRATAAPTR